MKIEKQLFLEEKKQNVEYMNLLKNKMNDIKKENEIEFEIPGKENI